MTGRLIAIAALAVLLAACARVVPAPQSRSLSYDEKMELGRIYEAKGERELALKQYRSAAISPGKALPYFSMGNVYLAMGLYLEAEDNFLEAIELDPTVGVFYNNLAWVHLETGNYSAAEHWSRFGLTMDIARPYIYMDTLGVIYTMTGRYEEAEGRLIEALGFAPLTDATALYHIYTHLLELYVQTGDDEKADKARSELEKLRMTWPGPGPVPMR